MTFDPAIFRQTVLDLLDAHNTYFGRELSDHALLRSQIAMGQDIHSRSTFPGHITTSALILDETGQRTLLIRHRSLQRWLQPGGHYEVPDALEASALREALEETGLAGISLDPWHRETGIPIDIDSHLIPARPQRGEPEHWHHDIRYLMRARGTDNLRPDLGEVEQAAWHPLGILAGIAPQALAHMHAAGVVYS
ncbi:NUDIX hydrolase [Microvirga rosea]|uniref:NUDIX hydrolase n=1 Tax=Microvirga rosea TaxID=2715425 RepID=UPI001D0B0D15|nr:NUDIX domain-containing protein [Microvirga rosea]MCB8820470.1 NUDIX domain-containing protein [Microvirga rosea]